MPLLQGTVWSLALFGWKHWNRTAQLSGSSTGAKVRKWWYRTNNWSIPKLAEVGKDARFAAEVGDVSWGSRMRYGVAPDFTDVL
jgi:hypothetical protein